MAKRSDFRVGETVEHKNLGRGNVMKAGDEYLVVKFEDQHQTVAEYDDRWFQIWPDMLKRYAAHQ